MSKTDKTDPIRLQEQRGVFPHHAGGWWNGIHFYANKWHRRQRRKAKTALKKLEEPQPRQTKHSARWDMY